MALRERLPEDPATLGPYTLSGRLGAGGMGVVYLGFDADGEPVAVKTLPRTDDAAARTRMRREAEVLASITSPRVARFVAADTTADAPWLALTYVAGPSLAEAPVPLAGPALRALAGGLAQALIALDAADVVHRDVKPANVVLSYDGPVLVDLGIARTSDVTAVTQAGTAVGSPLYMAPEQFRGEAVTAAIDVWGWGVVLAYAATGRPPFGDGPLEALAYRIMNAEPDLEGVPAWLTPTLKAALGKDPAARPAPRDLPGATISTVAIPLPVPIPTAVVAAVGPPAENVSDTQPVVTQVPLSSLATTVPRRRRPGVLLAACTALAVAGAAGIVFAVTRDSPEATASTVAGGTPTPVPSPPVASVTPVVASAPPSSTTRSASPSPSVSPTPKKTSAEPTRPGPAVSSPAPSPKPTPPPKPTPTPPPVQPWPALDDVLHSVPAGSALPAFPSAVPGYRRFKTVHTTARVVEGTGWVELGEQLEGAMTGCAEVRVYMRWRVLNEDVTVVPGTGAVPLTNVISRGKPGGAGWQSGNRCAQPLLRFGKSKSDANLTDVVITAQLWEATV